MKRLIACMIILVCVLGLAACAVPAPGPAPLLGHEIYTGKITELTDTTVTIMPIDDQGTEICFSITGKSLNLPADLAVGDVITVETAFMPDAKQPYPALSIKKESES